MRTVRTLLVDAFTDEPLAGNAAGVVPDADDLTDDQMQAVARELAVSETAFFSESEVADRSVRFFTPTTEIDLCGHATIASHVHLLEDGEISPGMHTLETAVGVLNIEVTENHTVWMTQNDPEIETVELEYDRVGSTLGIDPAALRDVGADVPMAVASTGLPCLVIPVNFLEHVGGAEPDMAKVEVLCEEVGAVGIYAFTFDAIDAESTLHGRMFAPLAGIPEDPVTGTASGAVGAYLRETDAFDESPEELRLEQGHFLDRPGYVRVRATEDGAKVGGRATTALDGRLVVPEPEEDGIIEC